MQNKHCEYIRISDNKKTAVLMVHGIVGSPRYFDRIIPLLPEDWSIYNILLDGHGKTVYDFSHTSMKKWKAQIKTILSKLQKEYEEVYIVAHSMGTLLTIECVIDNPNKVKCMILFAIPLKPRVKPVALTSALKVIFKSDIDEKRIDVAAKRQYSIAPDPWLWKYIGFAPRYIELLKLVGSIRRKIHLLNVTAVSFIHGKDEMVGKGAEKYIRKNKSIKIYKLPDSTHNYFPDEDFEIVKKVIKEKIDL